MDIPYNPYHLYIGKFKLPPPRHKKIKSYEKKPIIKAIVFDLDETLGSFSDLYILWKGIRNIYPFFDSLDELLHLYPEFIRSGIMTILDYVYQKKKKMRILQLYIYTNNQCPKEWVQKIANYFKKTLHIPEKEELFDRIIYAFKINQEIIEMNRTTRHKTYSDLIRCAVIDKHTEICFIDDVKYEQMIHDKVYYIQPKAFIHTLSLNEIIDRCILYTQQHICLIPLNTVFTKSYWNEWFFLHQRMDTIVQDKEIHLEKEKEISRKIMFSIREFLLMTTFYNHHFSKKQKEKSSLRYTHKCY